MDVKLERVDPRDRQVLERLLQLCLYEAGMDPGPDGVIDLGESLDPFFADDSFVPLFLTASGERVGFALLKLTRAPTGPDGRTPVRGANLVEELYVARPARRHGVGTAAVRRILDEYPGTWIVTTWPDAVRQAFWHHVAMTYAGRDYREFAPDEHKGYPGQCVWVIDATRRRTAASAGS